MSLLWLGSPAQVIAHELAAAVGSWLRRLFMPPCVRHLTVQSFTSSEYFIPAERLDELARKFGAKYG